MTILYNFASRSRPLRFFEALGHIQMLSASLDYYVLAKLDYDDETMNTQGMARLIGKQPRLIALFGESKSKVHAINRDIGDFLPPWDIMVVMSDDMRFTTQGFDDVIRSAMPSHLDAFLHFPDNYAKERVCTMSIMGRKYYERFNYVYHPDYYSLWCDDEATAVAKILGCYKLCNHGLIEHIHYANGGAVKDALYRRNDTYHQDRDVFFRRQAKNFDL